MTIGDDHRTLGGEAPGGSSGGSSLQLSRSHPWFILHSGQAGVTRGGSLLKGRAVGDTVSSTRASALLVLVGSSSHS